MHVSPSIILKDQTLADILRIVREDIFIFVRQGFLRGALILTSARTAIMTRLFRTTNGKHSSRHSGAPRLQNQDESNHARILYTLEMMSGGVKTLSPDN